MKIKTKIFLTLFVLSLLVALVGLIAVKHQRALVVMAATTEAENVATTIGSVLLSDSDQFHGYTQAIIKRLHELQQRDVVVVDTHELILADAVVADIGKTFTEDEQNEVGSTITDGKVRLFIENSDDSPLGMKQIVVPVKSRSGQIIGAVILEYTALYDELMQSAWATTRQLILVIVGSVLIGLVIAFYIGRSIAAPLQQLTKVATSFAGGNVDLPMPVSNKDEIGELARAFQNMMQKRREAEEELRWSRDNLESRVQARTKELENTHKQLVEISRKAGMAEVATGILHNVGNVLNSVNIASSCVIDSLKNSKTCNLLKVAAMLQEHESDLGNFFTQDPQGKQLPAYLGRLAHHLTVEQADALEEMTGLHKNIGHIKDIITMQQGLAKASGVTETISMDDLIDDALKMNASGLVRHDIRVTTDIQKVPLITIEKHKILQILVNLVNNAKQACDELDLVEKQLTIRATSADGMVSIFVVDNGIGISPENLTRIFAHGFTTKKEGHGFGLHSGALAAKEMGGSLNVQSEGTGKGATFILKLPLFPPTSAQMNQLAA